MVRFRSRRGILFRENVKHFSEYRYFFAPTRGKAVMSPSPVPLCARLTAIAGALVLSPDTMLMRLTKMQTNSQFYTSFAIVFYRGLGRLLLLPPLWMVAHRKHSKAFMRVASRLGHKRLLGGALLYTTQNVAFIVAANLTYVASVLAILATGPLFAAAASRIFLKEHVPKHTWVAAITCAACVAVIYSDSFVNDGNGDTNTSEISTSSHVLGNTIAMLVPSALALFWTVCKSSPENDMISALTLSGFLGSILALLVIFIGGAMTKQEHTLLGNSLLPVQSDNGTSTIALATQTISVAVAFALLTVGAKDVPSAEVSLIMLIELFLGPVLVWAAVGEMPSWRVWIGSGGVLITMAVESAVGLMEEKKERAAEIINCE